MSLSASRRGLCRAIDTLPVDIKHAAIALLFGSAIAALYFNLSQVVMVSGGCLLATLCVLHVKSLSSELERTRFLLDSERESGAILSKELELMLSAKLARAESPKEQQRIGAFWMSASTTRASPAAETQEEKEQRIAQYLEEVGGYIVDQDQLSVWAKGEERLHRLERDIENVIDILSRALASSGNKTESINEALFLLKT